MRPATGVAASSPPNARAVRAIGGEDAAAPPKKVDVLYFVHENNRQRSLFRVRKLL